MSVDLKNLNEDDNSFEKQTDLERYGVWVKKEPRDFSEFSADTISEKDNPAQFSAPLPESSFNEDVYPILEDKIDTAFFDDVHPILEDKIDAAFFNDVHPVLEEKIDASFFDIEDSSQNQSANTEIPAFNTDISSFDSQPQNFQENSSDLDFSAPDFDTEMEIDIDSFLSDDPAASETAEVDLDSFMSESGEIDVDAFMSSAEHMSADDFLTEEVNKKEKDEIIDEEPIEMELSFDDSFSSRTAADPVNDVESVHSEITDALENAEESVFDNFDDIFDNIVDESPASEIENMDESAAAADSDISAAYDDATEFDDLLNLIDSDESARIQTDKPIRQPKKAVQDIYLQVSTDDDESSINSETNKESETYAAGETEIEDISIFESGKELENFKQLDKPEESGYTKLLKPESSSLENDEELDLLISQADDISNSHTDTCNNDEVTLDDQETSMDDMTKALLDKIANEISSLRSEVSTLRDEFNQLKQDAKPCLEQKNTTSPDKELPEEIIESSGFFSDDVEDETIALSGDELNNILNNADFTEEFFEDSDKTSIPSVEEPEAFQFPEEELPDNAVSSSLDEFSDNTVISEEEIEGEQENPLHDEIEKELQNADNEFDVYTAPAGLDESVDDLVFEEKFEEPVLDDLEITMNNEIQEEIPEEINIPKVEDIIVEPSAEDLIEYNAKPLNEEEISDVDPDFSSFSEAFEIQDEDIPADLEMPEIEDNSKIITVEEIAPENLLNEEDETSADSVFDSSQWGNENTSSLPNTEASETIDEEEFDEESILTAADFSHNPKEDDSFEMITSETSIDDEQMFDAGAVDTPFDEEQTFDTPVVETTIDEEQTFDTSAVETPFDNEQPFDTVLNEDTETIETESTAPAAVISQEELDSLSRQRSEKQSNIPEDLRQEIKHVLSYMDQLLENLPEEKIVEFAQSEHFEVYKKLFKELGLS